MRNRPYLEAQILHCKEPKSKLIDFLKRKSDRFKDAQSTIIHSDSESTIFIQFSSYESMKQAYTKDYEIVEKFFQVMQEKKEDISNLFDFQPSISTQNSNQSKVNVINENDLYLILKYKTNAKDVIRTKYNFTYRIVDLVGIKSSYEEVEDGFILFYATKDDFLLTQMDLNNLADLQKWLEKKMIWKESYGEYFSAVQNWFSKKECS